MVKRIQLATTEAGTYYTLPGNSGELRNEAGQLTDTIFGQDYESTQSGLISATLNANALYKGFAGYVATLKKASASTPTADEATTQVGTSKSYQITDATHRLLDVNTPIVVSDGGVDKTTEVESIDFLNGIVTFLAAYAPTGAITVDGAYLSLTPIAGAKSFTLTQTAATKDTTDMPTAQANDGWKTFDYGLKTVSLEMGGTYKVTNGFVQALQDRENIYVEINPDGSGKSVFRGIFKYTQQSQSGDVGALEEETVTLNLAVPDGDLWVAPVAWVHTNSQLNQAIRIAVDGWQNNTLVWAKYLPDGTAGLGGQAVVTDVSLKGGLEAMNEFTCNLQLSDEPTTIA